MAPRASPRAGPGPPRPPGRRRGGRAAEERACASRFSILRCVIAEDPARPDADLLTSYLITASRLAISGRWPFSVIVTGSFSASFNNVVRSFEARISRRLAVTHLVIALRPGRHSFL